MTKRVVATVLWFYAGWYAGAMIAFLFGLSAALGPILATAAAGVVGLDPRHLIWARPASSSSAKPGRPSRAAPNPA